VLLDRADARAAAAGRARNPCLPPAIPPIRNRDGSISFSVPPIDTAKFARCSVARGFLTVDEAAALRGQPPAPSRLFPSDWQIVATTAAVTAWLALVAVLLATGFRHRLPNGIRGLRP
jgi:hypothetical protein